MNVETYILAIDQSTSGTKTLLVNQQGEVITRYSLEHKQYYPQPGWVEHDPLEIYHNVLIAAKGVLEKAGLSPSSLAAVTITNQRETALIWDRSTGLPIYNAIVWQCQRTAEVCTRLKNTGYEDIIRSKTGLMLDPYFSAAKFNWILEHVPHAPQLLAEGKLLAGTIDSWLLWKLTGGQIHATDYSNASRTSLFNIHTLAWDMELCNIFGVPSSLLPEVKASDALFGYTQEVELWDEQVAISGIIGDSQGALYGHRCFDTGDAKATYGTGTSVLMNIGSQPVQGGEGLVTTIAWGASGKVSYALEAVIRTTGDSIKWARDNLGLFSSFEEMQSMITELQNNEGVYLVPAFVGLGAPYWNPSARAAIVGMTRGNGKAHIVRAALESIGYQVRDAVQFIREQSGVPLTSLRTDGGGSSNSWLMQFQADILGTHVTRSTCAELSAMGSVYLGGLGVGYWSDPKGIITGNTSDQNLYEHYTPSMDEVSRQRLYAGWQNAVQMVIRSEQPLTPSSSANC